MMKKILQGKVSRRKGQSFFLLLGTCNSNRPVRFLATCDFDYLVVLTFNCAVYESNESVKPP